jgi:cupin 2 domain-containing protein
MDNIFDLPTAAPGVREVFENLLFKKNLRLERIVTLVPYSEPGNWYDQEEDEWVVLLKGTAEIEYKSGEIQAMKAGDHLFIPARKQHRVRWSSPGEVCIWLALHGKLK